MPAGIQSVACLFSYVVCAPVNDQDFTITVVLYGLQVQWLTVCTWHSFSSKYAAFYTISPIAAYKVFISSLIVFIICISCSYVKTVRISKRICFRNLPSVPPSFFICVYVSTVLISTPNLRAMIELGLDYDH